MQADITGLLRLGCLAGRHVVVYDTLDGYFSHQTQCRDVVLHESRFTVAPDDLDGGALKLFRRNRRRGRIEDHAA